jgi:hypothetical protein
VSNQNAQQGQGQPGPIAQQLVKMQGNGQQVQSEVLSSQHLSGAKSQKGAVGWTGFTGKTLWDWLNLLAVLAIPLLVAYFAYQQGQLSDVQHQNEVRAANIQHDRDVQAATDQQRATVLKTCEDDLKDLLLTKGLQKSGTSDEVRGW